jgi:hypothetical protein
MEPGPERVILCPHCGHKARVGTIRSYSMIGAIAWTDGKISSMAPDLPAITRCVACSEFYWISEAKVVGEFHEWGSYRVRSADPADSSAGQWLEGGPPAEWLSLEPVRHLAGEEYLLAIRKGLARTERDEKYLRISAWWSHNDQYRTVEANLEAKGSLSGQVRENLERLRELLDEDDYSDRLFKAEIERELGHFDEARRLLAFDFPEHVREVAGFIDQLAQRGDTLVRKIPKGNW